MASCQRRHSGREMAHSHSQERMRQRYGLVPTKAQLRRWAKLIRTGKCKRMADQGQRGIFWINDPDMQEQFRAVYDYGLRRIVTILPKG